jgi:hypothetical protein
MKIQDKRVPIIRSGSVSESESESESKEKRWDLDTRNVMCTVHRSRMSAGPIVSVREDQPQYTVGDPDPDPDSDPNTDGNQEQTDRQLRGKRTTTVVTDKRCTVAPLKTTVEKPPFCSKARPTWQCPKE